MKVPPPFRPHPLIRGGHLQTFATTLISPPETHLRSRADLIRLPDGDQIAIHDACPENWRSGDPSLLLIHGLAGCHRSSYMTLTAQRFHASGTRVFRLDMRGCGNGIDLAIHLNHAGRSDDIFAAINHLHTLTMKGPIWVAGISLGGNQLLKLLCELGSGFKSQTPATERIERAAAVAPPIDLIRCSDQMQRPHMRLYNRYFIRRLLQTIPAPVRNSERFQSLDLLRQPKTLYELDDRITAPLSGFEGANDYYQRSSTHAHLIHNRVPTLLLTSADDPIVPVSCFRDSKLDANTNLEITSRGGHVGYISAGPVRYWLDRRLHHWFLEE